MPGTKIINVLKDDTFKDILDLFRKSDAEDVVFVLPKRAKLFRREDHFAAFASESKRSNRNVSVLCANPDINDWARKYGFTVIAKGGTATKAAADETSDADEEVRDPNTDAFEEDVEVPSDERIGVTDTSEEDETEGMHVADPDAEPDGEEDDDEAEDVPEESGDVEDETESDLDQDLQRYGENDMDQYDEDGNLIAAGAEPIHATLAGSRSLDGVSRTKKGRSSQRVKVGARARPKAEDGEPVEISRARPKADEDYIDAVWKERVASREPEYRAPERPRRRWFGLRREEPQRIDASRSRPTSSRTRGIIVATVVLLLIAAGAIIIFSFGSASVTIVPVSRDLEFQVTVQASDAFASVDPLFNKIPGQLFEITKDVEREFPATGSAEVAAKARGTITVANTYSSSPQTLIATTRFESPDGMVFRTLQTVSVPGSSVQDGEVVPGQVTVDVIADKPGGDYNIDATAFTIPAFKEQGLTERYEKITGSSDAAFAGGAVGLSGIVTEEDIESARAAVADELRTQIEQAFEAQAGDLELLNGTEVEIGELVVSAEIDDAMETFVVSATGTLRTVGYRQEDLSALVEEHVKRNWQLVAIPDQLELLFDNIRFADDRAVLAFDVSAVGKGYLPIDEEQIREDIRGMKRQAVRDYFRSAENVRASTVILSPIWVRSVPSDPERIEISVTYTAEPEL
jgi:hypothetical protein